MLLDTDKIKELVQSGQITGISLDTSVFDSEGLGFEFGFLHRMKQFHGSSIRVVIPDAVHGEVFDHLVTRTKESQSALRKALKFCGSDWGLSKEQRRNIQDQVHGGHSPEQQARIRLQAFMDSVGARIIAAQDHASFTELLGRYFKGDAPFSRAIDAPRSATEEHDKAKKSKKAEFPDAIALLTLESFAQSANTKLLVVSKDADWESYCASSESLILVKDLGPALGYFQDEYADYLCNLISHEIENGDSFDVLEHVRVALIDQEDKIVFTGNAEASYDVEVECYQTTLTLVGTGPSRQILEPVEYDEEDDYLVARMSVLVKADLDWECTFGLWDSIDKDVVHFGSVDESTSDEIQVHVLITFHPIGTVKHTLNRDTHVQDVEILDQEVEVDLGEVSPDWYD